MQQANEAPRQPRKWWQSLFRYCGEFILLALLLLVGYALFFHTDMAQYNQDKAVMAVPQPESTPVLPENTTKQTKPPKPPKSSKKPIKEVKPIEGKPESKRKQPVVKQEVTQKPKAVPEPAAVTQVKQALPQLKPPSVIITKPRVCRIRNRSGKRLAVRNRYDCAAEL